MKALSTTIISMVAAAGFAEPTTFTSTAARTRLVELYTSEGCSSCPAAEERLNQLATHKGLWSDFVPIAFHVDYWNYLGWPDRFSTAHYTARQQAYSKQWRAQKVYTPCFVIDGKPTRGPTKLSARDQPGPLKATLRGNHIAIEFTPRKTQTALVAWAAPLSGKEITHVRAGENRGRTLEHCFAALDLQGGRMTEQEGVWTAAFHVDRSKDPCAIAVWVSTGNSPAPLQATGGWLGE